MKKVYSLVNITKAKDQEAVQSICIKVSLRLLRKRCYFLNRKHFLLEVRESGLCVELGRGKHKVALMGVLE